jgi:uncharacterized FlaG/YvyC family protein
MNISSIGSVAVATPTPPHPLSDEQKALVSAVHAINAAELFGEDNELAFAFSRNSRSPVVRLVDRKTREVVEQFPAEYVLRMAEELKRDSWQTTTDTWKPKS